MNKKILTHTVCFTLIILSFTGCIEETPPNKTSITVYVDANGGADYTKIQDAINHVANNGTIFVNNGTYHETLKIDKSIKLIGSNANKTIIEYKTKSTPHSDNIILIEAENCTIQGFNIKSENWFYNTSDIIGIKINSPNNIITNNIISSTYKGIYIENNSKNNTISWNTISNIGYGIEIFNSERNDISKNNITSCITYGIYLLFSDNNEVYNNMIINNNYGIRLKGSKNNRIFNNDITTNKYGLLFCCGAKNNVLYNNIFKQNFGYNARDDNNNKWDSGSIGNYWDDYLEKYPDAIQINGIWDTPYSISGGNNIDRYPIVNPIDI